MSISDLHYRVLQLSRLFKIGHLSSNLTAVDIIDEIYRTKRADDVFVLSAGHAGLAHYVCLEKHEGKDAEDLYRRHKTHPHRAPEDGIHVSAGSLGCGITIALGMAMARRDRDVYCLISDGEAYEGAVWEGLNAKHKHCVDNLKVYLNANGQTCIEEVDDHQLVHALRELDLDIEVRYTDVVDYPFLKPVESHYHQLRDEDWAWVEANR